MLSDHDRCTCGHVGRCNALAGSRFSACSSASRRIHVADNDHIYCCACSGASIAALFSGFDLPLALHQNSTNSCSRACETRACTAPLLASARRTRASDCVLIVS